MLSFINVFISRYQFYAIYNHQELTFTTVESGCCGRANSPELFPCVYMSRRM
jgi:hypothetical protein